MHTPAADEDLVAVVSVQVCSACRRLLTAGSRVCGTCGAPARSVDELPAGTLVGAYRIERVLGEGGMGFVYEAVHELLQRRSAIKFLRPEFAGDADVVARFMQEARAVNVIDHEHIVNVYDYGDALDGSAYFVMELLEGETLGDLVHRRGRLPLPLVVHVFGQLMGALAAAHAKKIVHRDLKPANVLLVRRDDDPCFVKLLDFGVAQLRGAGRVGAATALGTVLGTPQYMSPEQVQGLDVDARADVWALGVMLYRAATGHLPFAGETFQELGANILTTTPRPPRVEAPDAAIPAALERLILRALERDPAARHASVEDMRIELGRVAIDAGLDEDAVRAWVETDAAREAIAPGAAPGPASAVGSLAESNPLYQGVREVAAPPVRAPRSSRGRVVLAAGLAALLGGATAAFLVSTRRGAAAATTVSSAGPVLVDGSAAPAAPTADPLRAAIASGDLAAQNDAVAALALVESPRTASLLHVALAGGGPEIRLAAARALRTLHLPDSAPKLRAALDASGERLRVELAACLHATGDADARSLLEAALADPRDAATAAAALVSRPGSSDAVAARARAVLVDTFTHAPAGRDSWRRAAAALALVHDAAAIAALAEEMAAPDPARAVAAAAALAAAGDAAALAYLGRVVADPDFSRRGEAALALAHAGDRAALAWVPAGLASTDANERRHAIGVAARLGEATTTHASAIAALAAHDDIRAVRLTAHAALLGR